MPERWAESIPHRVDQDFLRKREDLQQAYRGPRHTREGNGWFWSSTSCYYGHGREGSLLSTAGGLVFASDGDGKPLWHTRIGNASNPPWTCMLDGKQYVIVATGDNIWSFVMYWE